MIHNMITINYHVPIYLKMVPDDYEIELSGEHCFSNCQNNHNYVFYQTQKSQYDVVDFVFLAMQEYCKLKINSVFVNISIM